MQLKNIYNLPESIVRAIQLDDYDYPKDIWTIPTSQLISPLRKSLLEQRHDSELVEDVSDNIWRLFGNCMHYILGKQGDGKIVEKRIGAFINDFTVTGKPDNFDPITGTLLDYKVTSVWSLIFSPEGKREWTEQMNVYVWLLRKNRYVVNLAKIIAILRDWQEREAQKNLDYPQVAIQQLDIDLWTEEVQEGFIWEKLNQRKQYQTLPDDRLPVCTEEERWKAPDVYAFKKEVDSERAVRVFKDELEADKYGLDNPKLIKEVRVGESRRCLRYCSVKNLCDFGRDL